MFACPFLDVLTSILVQFTIYMKFIYKLLLGVVVIFFIPILIRNSSGERPRKCEGQVTIKGVEFTYPTRPDIKILKGLTVSVEPGQTLALVGQSGCGKSTLIQLLERFYDSDEGRILIDGKKE